MKAKPCSKEKETGLKKCLEYIFIYIKFGIDDAKEAPTIIRTGVQFSRLLFRTLGVPTDFDSPPITIVGLAPVA